MKKTLSVLMAVLFVLSVFPALTFSAFAANADASLLKFSVNSDGTYTVSGHNGTLKGDLVIPSAYNGKAVTGIGGGAFYDCSQLKSVTIPNSVTSVGYGTFMSCTGLIGITVDAANTAYSSKAGVLFNKDQTNLIQYPIGNPQKSYIIPSSVTCIRGLTFYDCKALTSVTIPNSVTSIGNSAFYNCWGLTSATIPSSVTGIGYSAFDGCTGLTSVTIGSGVTSIGAWAFEGCTGLTSVAIPNSVTSIGESALLGCTGLTSVMIGSGVTSIGNYVLKDCTGLTDITVDAANTAYSSKAGVLFNKDQTNLIQYPIGNSQTGYVIPSSVTNIGAWAFYGCPDLTSVTIPSGVMGIGVSAFDGCTGLTSVTIPNGVTSIEKETFEGCTGLTSVTIPSSVTSIGDSAFAYCTSLTSVTIPSSVTSIEIWAFFDCTGLTSVTIPNSVTSIGAWAFENTGFTSVTIPSSVTDIGINAFGYYNEDGENILIPNFVISCAKGSAAEAYAKMSNIKIVYVESAPTLSSVAVKTNPTKTAYVVGDTLDTTGLTLEATYSDGSAKAISLADCLISPTALNSVGTQTITVTYQGKTATFTVTVAPTLSSVAVKTNPTKTAYVVGDTLDTTGLTLEATYSDGSTEAVSLADCSISPTALNTVGMQTITVTYQGKTATFTVTVAPTLSSVAVKINPTKTAYVVGDTLDTTGLTLEATYSDGSTKAISLADCLISPMALNTVGTQTITVTYQGKVTSFKVSVGLATPKLTAIENATNGVTLEWSGVSGASCYIIYRRIGFGGWKAIATIKSGNTVSYLDQAVKSGMTYTYTVRAYSGSTRSGCSTGGISIKFLSVPKIRSAKSSRKGITVKYGKVTGACGYIVYRRTASGSWARLGTTKCLSFLDKSAKKGETYDYTVRAYSGNAMSAYYDGAKCKR